MVATALALALTGALVGGSTRWAACLGALLALAAAVPHVTSRRTASRLGPLVTLIAVALVATAVQLVALPEPLAAILAPHKLALVRDHGAALGRPAPTWVVASYDPPATLVELAKLVGYAALAWGATRLASQRRARPWLGAAAVGGATLVAVIALAHRALGARALYGVFSSPIPDHPPAPLINDNHLAALTALAVPLALGLGLAWTGTRRALAFGAALVCATCALLTSSRGGAVGLVAGLVVATIALIAQRRAGVSDDERRAPIAVTLPALVVAACALTLFGLVAARDVAFDLGHTRLAELSEPSSKYQVWSAASPLIVENHWLGVGRGGFEQAFPRLAPPGDIIYSHAENSYLQVVLDWGVPAALALALALLALGRAALKRWRHGPLEAGALGALASLAIHELADFSLEMPVVAMTAIAAAAILVPARIGTDDSRSPVARRTLGVRGGLLALGAILIAIAASPLGRTARADRARLPRADAPGALAASLAVLERHPSDGLAAGHVAAALFAARDPRAPAVIGRALYLRPQHPGLHVLAAHMLAASQRRSQAAVEFGLAIAESSETGPLVDDLLATLPDAAIAARGLPDDPRQLWRLYGALQQRERLDVAYLYAERLALLQPRRYEPQLHLAWAATALARYQVGLTAARTAHALHPSVLTALALARAHQGLGQFAEGIAALAASPPGDTDAQRAEVAGTLAGLQLAVGDQAGARATLADAIDRLAGDRALEAQLRLSLAAVEDALGHPNQAAWERQRASELRAGQP